MKNLIKIEKINSSNILEEAIKAGETHLELIASEGEGDRAIAVYWFPETGIRVINTNGDPIWEENDPTGFHDTLKEYGIEL